MSSVIDSVRLNPAEAAADPSLLETLHESARRTAGSGAPDPAAIDTLRASGLFGTAVPVEYGGHGADAALVNDVVAQIATVNPSLSIVLFQHFAVSARIAEWGTEGQKVRWLPSLADGRLLAASAWSERGAGAAKQNLGTLATFRPDGTWLLDGSKAFTTSASIADIYLVLAQSGSPETDPETLYGAAGQSFFMVEADNPGLVPDLSLDLVGMRGSATGFVEIHDCVVDDADRLGPEGHAAAIIAGVRESGASLGAVAVGVAQAALDVCAKHARKRGLIGEQAIRHQLVELGTKVDAARAIVDRAGRRTSPMPGDTTLHSKIFASEVAETVCLEASRMLGSSGYVTGAWLNQLMADARAVALMGPTNALCRDIVGQSWAG